MVRVKELWRSDLLPDFLHRRHWFSGKKSSLKELSTRENVERNQIYSVFA
jgi:hypothetical protein